MNASIADIKNFIRIDDCRPYGYRNGGGLFVEPDVARRCQAGRSGDDRDHQPDGRNAAPPEFAIA